MCMLHVKLNAPKQMPYYFSSFTDIYSQYLLRSPFSRSLSLFVFHACFGASCGVFVVGDDVTGGSGTYRAKRATSCAILESDPSMCFAAVPVSPASSWPVRAAEPAQNAFVRSASSFAGACLVLWECMARERHAARAYSSAATSASSHMMTWLSSSRGPDLTVIFSTASPKDMKSFSSAVTLLDRSAGRLFVASSGNSFSLLPRLRSVRCCITSRVDAADMARAKSSHPTLVRNMRRTSLCPSSVAEDRTRRTTSGLALAPAASTMARAVSVTNVFMAMSSMMWSSTLRSMLAATRYVRDSAA
eukprot:PhM_4_TR10845/c0_g1_i1/m.67775